MENKKSNKILEIRKYYLYFMLYAIIGWIYEVFLEVVVYKWGFSNRGVLYGTYCPVYGFGALAFIFSAYYLIKGKSTKRRICMIPVVFLACMLIATAIELVTSYICEFFMGSWPWQTYANYKINFQARIALSPSVRFGIGGLAFLYVLQPIFERMCSNLSEKALVIITNIVGIGFICDAILTVLL